MRHFKEHKERKGANLLTQHHSTKNRRLPERDYHRQWAPEALLVISTTLMGRNPQRPGPLAVRQMSTDLYRSPAKKWSHPLS